MKKTIIKTSIFATAISCMSLIPFTKIMDTQKITNQIAIEQQSLNSITNNTDGIENFQLEVDISALSKRVCLRNPKIPFTIPSSIKKNINMNINTIFYNNEEQFNTEFFRQAAGLNSIDYVNSISISQFTHPMLGGTVYILRGHARAEITDRCHYVHPVYPDRGRHDHSNLKIDVNNHRIPGSEEISIQIVSHKPFTYAGKQIDKVINPKDIFIKLDEDNTIQGFKKNYLGLDLNSNYLKALILNAINLNQSQVLLTEESNKPITQTKDFNTIIDYFIAGKLFDPEHSMTNRIVDDNELSQPNKNVRYWINKLVNNESIDAIHDSNNWLSDYRYIKQYNINANDNNICFLYEQLLLNKNLKLEIDWESNIKSGTIDLNFYYDKDTKSFIFKETNSNKYRIQINEANYDKNVVSIKQIRLCDASFGYRYYLCNVDMADQSNTPAKLYDNKFSYTYVFDIAKLVKVKQDLSKQYWIDLFRPYAIDVEDWIENPEKFNNDEFKNLITNFANDNSPIKVMDGDLDSYLKKDPELSFTKNKYIKELIHDYTIKTYNSVNGVELSINYFDYNSSGIKQSDKLINKTVRYSLTNDKLSESTFTQIVKNKIISREDFIGTPEEFVIDKFIGYENNRDNKLITTKLSKQDWLVNALNSIQITENNKYGIKGIINYNDNSSIANFLNHSKNQISNSVNFEVLFHDSIIPNVGIDKDGSINGIIPAKDIPTSLWVGIGSIVLIILIFSTAYYFISKKKKAEIASGKKPLTDNVEDQQQN